MPERRFRSAGRDRGANALTSVLVCSALCVPLAAHVAPLIALLVDSFWVEGRFSFAVHADVLGASSPWRILLTTLHVSLWGAALATVIGVWTACSIARLHRFARNLLEPWIVLPLALPPYLVGLAWIYACGPRGLLVPWFSETGLPLDGPWSAGTILALCWVGIPHLVVRMALANVDRAAIDAGRLTLGTSRTFLRITWPALRPAATTAFLVCFLLIATTFDVPALLQVETQGNAILATFHHTYDARRATSLALPLLGIALLLVAFLVRRRGHGVAGREGGGTNACNPTFRSTAAATFFPALIAILVGVLPIATLIAMAGGLDSIDSMLRTAGKNLRLGLEVAFVAATISTVAAYLLAELSLHPSRIRGRAVHALVLCAMALPPTLLGIGLIQVYGESVPPLRFLYETPWILVIAAIGRFLPFAFLIVHEGLRSLGPRATESGRLASLSRPTLWVQLHLRAITCSLLAAFFLVFALSLTELPAAQLVAPPGRTTLPIRLFTILHYGQDTLVASMCVALMAFAGVSFLIVRLGLLSRSTRR